MMLLMSLIIFMILVHLNSKLNYLHLCTLFSTELFFKVPELSLQEIRLVLPAMQRATPV